MLEKKEAKRIDWVDVAKGISILSVVLYHTLSAHKAIFNLYNVPAFLFISGYLFKKDGNLSLYFKKKGMQLFVPYIAFMLVMVFPLEFLFMHGEPLMAIIKRLVRDVLAAQNIGIPATTFWFIPCIFFTQQIYNLIANKFERRAIHWLMLLSLVLAYVYYIFLDDVFLPGAVQSVLHMLPIFHIGAEFRRKYEDLFAQKKIYIWMIVIAAIIALTLSEYYWRKEIHLLDMARNQLGIPFVTFAMCILAILLVTYISKAIASLGGIVYRAFVVLGTASLVVMITHQPIQYIFERYFDMGYVRIIPTIILSVLLYYLFLRWKWTRFLFLGMPMRKG